MRAHDLFPVCRERFRRPKNPETQNENVSFLAESQYLTIPANGACSWQSHNSMDVLKTNAANPASWAHVNGPYGGLFSRRSAGSSTDSLTLTHDHTQETGELYLRVAFRLGELMNADWNKVLPVFCIRPMSKPGEPNDVTIWLRPGSSTRFVIGVDWIAKDGTPLTMETPSILRPYDSYRYMDCRLYIPADDYAYMNVFIDGNTVNPRWGAMSETFETDPHGFKDTPGTKQIKWGNTDTSNAATIPAYNPIQPHRLGIGNLIKFALPS